MVSPILGLPRPTNGHFFGLLWKFFTLLNDSGIITYTVTRVWPGVCPWNQRSFSLSFPSKVPVTRTQKKTTTMDIARPSNARKKRIRQIVYGGVLLLSVALVSYGLSRLKPAAPTVERAVIWPDT